MKQNNQKINCTPWLDTAWSLTGAPDTDDEGLASDIDVLSHLADCVGSLLEPTAVEYVLQSSGEKEAVSKTLNRGETLDWREIVESVTESAEGRSSPRLARFEVTDCRVSVSHDNKRIWLDTETDIYQTVNRDGEPTGSAELSPIGLTVFNLGLTSQTDAFEVVVRSHTDLWFDESADGESNRKRLSEVLHCLFERFNAETAEFDSSRYSTDGLRRRGFGDLTFEK